MRLFKGYHYIQRISSNEKVFIRGNLNDQIGREAKSFERVHGGFGYSTRNEIGTII